MIIGALITRLKTVHSRVFQSVTKKQNNLPAITVNLNGELRYMHWGSTNPETGLIASDFDITIWAINPEDCNSIGSAVTENIENFIGIWPDGFGGQISIAGVEITDVETDFDGNTETYTYSILATITHAEV